MNARWKVSRKDREKYQEIVNALPVAVRGVFLTHWSEYTIEECPQLQRTRDRDPFMDEDEWIYNVLCHFLGEPIGKTDVVCGTLSVLSVHATGGTWCKPYCECHNVRFKRSDDTDESDTD